MQIARTLLRIITFPVVCAAILLIAANVGACGQSTVASTGAQPLPAAPQTEANPHRIQIDAEVTDKSGHHIGGLTAQDFTLLDNKQPAKIIDFREVDTRSPGADPVSVVIVVDTINTDFTAVAREREQLGEFLKQDGGHLAHPTSLAILTEKGLQMEKARTEDGNALDAGLSGANSGLRMEGRTAGFYGATDRLQWSLAQLSQLAAYEATQPGRKLAFFISSGWPLLSWAGVDATTKERQWTFNGIVGLTNGLREAHVTLYALDPFSLGRTNPFYYESYLKGVSKPGDAEYADLGLQVLATHTGGLVETTGMDIKGEINNAIRDASASYELTIEAPPADRKDEYHELHLEVDKPGVKVRTTTGYYANPSLTVNADSHAGPDPASGH